MNSEMRYCVICVRLNMDSAGWEEFRGILFSREEMEWSWFMARTGGSADCSTLFGQGLLGFQGELFLTGNFLGIPAGLY